MSLKIDQQQVQDAADDFWQLSCAFYSESGVMPLLLQWQNKEEKNVNLLLFSLWFSWRINAIISEKQSDAILASGKRSKQWLERLRRQRFELDSCYSKPYPQALKIVRDILLESELKFEKIHQNRLVEGLMTSTPQVNTLLDNNGDNLDWKVIEKNLIIINGELKFAGGYQPLIDLWLNFVLKNN